MQLSSQAFLMTLLQSVPSLIVQWNFTSNFRLLVSSGSHASDAPQLTTKLKRKLSVEYVHKLNQVRLKCQLN